MNEKLSRLLSSAKTTIALLLIYATGLAAATFLEKYYGTDTAKTYVYYSPVFIFIQFLLVVNFLFLLVGRGYLRSRKWGLLVSHFSFMVILAGALVSHLSGEEGMVHIREGETTDQLMVRDGSRTLLRTLPFSLELIRFDLHRYPGSSSPSSYESELRVHVDGQTYEKKVFMNNVLDVKGYRFYQASFDPDEQGTILSANRDGYGRAVTYTGYLGLLIGLIGCLTGRHSRFRRLNRRFRELRHASCLLLFLFAGSAMTTAVCAQAVNLAEATSRYSVPAGHADLFGRLPMQAPNGRMIPVNTFSSEVVRKIHKAAKVGSLNPDQFLLSALAMPEVWGRVPLIVVPDRELARQFGLQEPACAFAEVFDANGRYKLEGLVEKAYAKLPAQRSAFDKDLLKFDEQVNIFNQLLSYRMLNLFPLDGDAADKWYAPGDDLSGFSGKDSLFVSHIMPWYLAEVRDAMQSGDWSKADEVLGMISVYQQAKNKTLEISSARIDREIRYNRLDVFRKCKIGYLVLGGLTLIIGFLSFSGRSRFLRLAYRGLAAGVVGVFLFHTFGMGLRWYIGGYAPWSNSYETMVYVAWATVAGGLLFMRRSPLTFALAALFAGIILFVSGLNWMDPQIGTLVPVLKSPWLMFHVAVIVAAYGFFGIGFLLGLTNLVLLSFRGGRRPEIRISRVCELTLVNEMALIIGLALMTTGTFLGAVWANESWGRYWGWDPKETWALITMLVYAVATHVRLIKGCDNAWLFNVLSVVAFASVLMTFFGVNYFLSGMHSYGENGNISGLFAYLYGAFAGVLILIVVSRLGYVRNKVNMNI